MSDTFFFPLAAMIAGLFVYLALDPAADRPPTGPLSAGGRNAEDVTLSGVELHRFLPGAMKGLQIIETPDGQLLRITRGGDELYEDPRSGAHVLLAEDLEFAFERRPVEIVIEARAAGEYPAAKIEANYMARLGAESGWQSFELTPDFQTYSFTFSPPPRGQTLGYDYLGVRPAIGSKRRTVEIRSIRLHAAGPKVY